MADEVGISIRLIRNYDPEKDKWPTYIDAALASCHRLGHTFQHNKGEAVCNVCGLPNPHAVAKVAE